MLKDIIGKKVKEVYEWDSFMLIVFDDDTKLEITDTYDGFLYDYPSTDIGDKIQEKYKIK